MTENSVKYRTNIRNYLLVMKIKIKIKGLHKMTRMQNSPHIMNTFKHIINYKTYSTDEAHAANKSIPLFPSCSCSCHLQGSESSATFNFDED